ncbi:MAG: DUF4910 domain-containing protein [Firmicutes bacterium]|nr:DUF4910 domain-containing protein [Bacillota bacterium]
MLKAIAEALRPLVDGARALDDVAAVSRLHRIQNSPGYRAAADHVERRARELGLRVTRHRIPAGSRRMWSQVLFPAWHCRSARLEILLPDGRTEILAEFPQDPLSIVQRSAPTAPGGVEAEVVVVEDAERPESWEGVEAAGRIVLVRGDAMRLHRLAVRERGALGLLFDNMNEIPGLRTRADLADHRQYTSFWWEGQEPRGFGFVLTPAQGERLRQAAAEAAAAGRRLRARAVVDAHFEDGEIEVIDAFLPPDGVAARAAVGDGRAAARDGGVAAGDGGAGAREDGAGAGTEAEEVWCVAHLCHPAPFANDNASGVAAALAAAGALARASAEGRLGPRRRGVRFLWMPEMTGTTAYLAHVGEAAYRRAVAALNLDMVGEDEHQTGGALTVEHPPLARPSFAGYLLAQATAAVVHERPSLGGERRVPAVRWTETPFSGGSDHMILSDPLVGVPAPMLIHWPDRFYHTSADTLDKVDPHMLVRSATIAAAWLHFAAAAGGAEAAWLAAQMAGAMPAELHRDAETRWAQGWRGGKLQRWLRYRKDRQLEALDDLARLVPEEERGAFAEAAAAARAAVEGAWQAQAALWRAREAAAPAAGGAPVGAGGAGSPVGAGGAPVSARVAAPAGAGATLRRPHPAATLDGLLRTTGWPFPDFAARIRRIHPGPVWLRGHLSALPVIEQDAWDAFADAHPTWAHATHILDYYMDGTRMVAEVSEAAEWDTGVRDDEFAMGYVALLARLGLVEFM